MEICASGHTLKWPEASVPTSAAASIAAHSVAYDQLAEGGHVAVSTASTICLITGQLSEVKEEERQAAEESAKAAGTDGEGDEMGDDYDEGGYGEDMDEDMDEGEGEGEEAGRDEL
eukprot:156806-Pelagomonas_calceolata.AAC.9